ncbi:uncharacterized protein G2W53_003999 [Senna tora]|uniref:Uncharacterized protein n=1 Tax=Senna tora TaxID=362788 RepID=A0A834XBN7_9FABA|nr:uncharacterized protein G2W53_003999 [Senna tora]
MEERGIEGRVGLGRWGWTAGGLGLWRSEEGGKEREEERTVMVWLWRFGSVGKKRGKTEVRRERD